MSQRGKSAVKRKTSKPISKGYKVVNPSDFQTDKEDGYDDARRKKIDNEMLSGYIREVKRASKTKKAA